MARKGRALQYLTATITQASADAFVQTTIATALSGQTRTVYRLASLEIELPAPVFVNAVDFQLSITRKSFSAMPTSMTLEKSNIWYYRKGVSVASSVGVIQFERTLTKLWNDDDAPVLVEDPIYVQMDTATTSASNVAYLKLGYWLDSITEVDRLQLIANSLQ